MTASRPTPDGSSRWWRILPLGLLVATLGAYANSFAAPFLFDDHRFLAQLPFLQQPGSGWAVLAATARPLTQLTLLANYLAGGLDVWGFHAVNVAIHGLAGLVLFGLMRRTLAGQPGRGPGDRAAGWLAFAATLIWLVHPLQTASVTYIIQRAEALTGLYYLFTLYGILRGAASTRRAGWHAAAVVSCAAGMGSKPVMVTAPVMALLYDAAFIGGSVRRALRERRGLYAGLAATWLVLAVVLLRAPQDYLPTAGWTAETPGPLAYLLTEFAVILHYLRLAFWPHPLVLDYAWPVAQSPGSILVPALALGGLLALTGWAWRRHRGLGFLGLWVFVILAPTSSVIPLADPAFEHRMYLPLAAVVLLSVLAARALIRAAIASRPQLARGLAAALVGAVALTLGAATHRRNAEFGDPASIWRTVVARAPHNPRGHSNLGVALARQGRLDEATAHYTEALRLAPDYAEAHNNLGNIRAQEGRLEGAVRHYTEALRLVPEFAEAHNNLGNALAAQGRLEEAVARYREALRVNPGYAEAHNNLGVALTRLGAFQQAASHYAAALRLKPAYSSAHRNLAWLLARQRSQPATSR